MVLDHFNSAHLELECMGGMSSLHDMYNNDNRNDIDVLVVIEMLTYINE